MAGNLATIRFRNANRILQAGQPIGITVVARIKNAINCSLITVNFFGFEQSCWKKVTTPTPRDSARKVIVDQQLIAFQTEDRMYVIGPGEHTWNVDWVLPTDLPSSFHLPALNSFTGLFYEVASEFHTMSRLGTEPVPVGVQGIPFFAASLVNAHDITRRATKSFLAGGYMLTRCTLLQNAIVAGEMAAIRVELENYSSKPINAIHVTLRQQLRYAGPQSGSMLAANVTVQKGTYTNCKQSNQRSGHYSELLFFAIPDDIPHTQATRNGLLTVEYHLVVEVDQPWVSNLRVRIPCLILEHSVFPAPEEIQRRKESQIFLQALRDAEKDRIQEPSSVAGSSAKGENVKESSMTGRGREVAMGIDGAAAPGAAGASGLYSSGTLSESGNKQQPQRRDSLSPMPNSGRAPVDRNMVASAEQRKAYQTLLELFRSADQDENGCVDRFEFKQLHAALVAKNLCSKPLEVAWEEMDADGDNVITVNELIDWMQMTEQLPSGGRSPPGSPRVGGISIPKGARVEPYPLLNISSKGGVNRELGIQNAIEMSVASPGNASPMPSPLIVPRKAR